MKKIIKFLIPVFVLLLILVPVFYVSAAFDPAKGIVPCDGSVEHPCDFNAFMDLINNVITFLLFYLALPIAGIMFAYAGFLMVTAGESASEARTKAKGIFMNALIGLALAAACYLIVYSILKVLGYDGGWIGF